MSQPMPPGGGQALRVTRPSASVSSSNRSAPSISSMASLAQPEALPANKWSPSAVAIWLRGVEKLSRPVLDQFIHQKVDGAALLALTSQRLQQLAVDNIGQQAAILQAVTWLKDLPQYLASSPVSLLGSQLLQAGRTIDTQPLEAVATMTAALTQTLETLDLHPPPDRDAYFTIRNALLTAADAFLNQTESLPPVEVVENKRFVKGAKDFVRQILPCLQQLRSLCNSEAGSGPVAYDPEASVSAFVQTVTLQGSAGTTAGLSFRTNAHGLIVVADIAVGSVAEKAGMLRVGDEIVLLNDQQVVGWRVRALEAVMKRSNSPLRFAIRLSAAEFDERIAQLMQHARAIRDSISISSRRTSHATSLGQTSGHTLTLSRHSSLASNMVPAIQEEAACMEFAEPHAGREWPRGTKQAVEWTSSNIPPGRTVCVILSSQSRGVSMPVADLVLNTGTYAWDIPDDLAVADDYRLTLTLNEDSAASNTRKTISCISDPFAIGLSPSQQRQSKGAVDSLRRNQNLYLRTAKLARDAEGNLGFELDGLFISDIDPLGPAQKEGTLQIGDQLVEIDGRLVLHESHLALLNMLQDSGRSVELTVVSNLDGYKSYLEGFNQLHEEFRQLLICRQVEIPACPGDIEAYGLGLIGTHSIVVVGSVVAGLPAASCKHLGPSTCVVHINGQPTYGAKSSEALRFLDRNKHNPATLVVTQDRETFIRYVQKIIILRSHVMRSAEDIEEIRANRKHRRIKLMQRNKAGSGSRSPGRDSQGRDSPGALPQREVVVRTLSFDDHDDDDKDGNIDLDVPCPSLTQPQHEGWLTKLGGSGLTPKNWRRRWFVLKDGVVYYYKTPSDDKALGAFFIPGYLVMPPKPGKRMHNRFGFMITKDHCRPYYVCADSHEEMKRWMNAMSLAAIQYTKTAEEVKKEQGLKARDHGLVLNAAGRRDSASSAENDRRPSTAGGSGSDQGGYDNVAGAESLDSSHTPTRLWDKSGSVSPHLRPSPLTVSASAGSNYPSAPSTPSTPAAISAAAHPLRRPNPILRSGVHTSAC